jgi:hypothetical protein
LIVHRVSFLAYTLASWETASNSIRLLLCRDIVMVWLMFFVPTTP